MEATELATPLSTTVLPRDFGGLLPAATGLGELTIHVLKMPEERLSTPTSSPNTSSTPAWPPSRRPRTRSAS
jgi:hypothetical protein